MNDENNLTFAQTTLKCLCRFGEDFSQTDVDSGSNQRLKKQTESNTVESSFMEEQKPQQTLNVPEIQEVNREDRTQGGHLLFPPSSLKNLPVPPTTLRTNPELPITNRYGLLPKLAKTVLDGSTKDCVEPDELSIHTSSPGQDGWMSIEITSSKSIELLQLSINDTVIGIGSSKIRMHRGNENAKHFFYIFFRSNNQPGPINLRLRTETEPFHEFTRQILHSNEDKLKDGKTILVDSSKSFMMPTKTDCSYIHEPYVINILLIGRSQVGKSTLIESLTNPTYSSSKTGISQTREPTYKQLKMTSEDRREYTVNIIDTPGLREIRNDPNETRTDEELLHLLKKVFDDGRIRALNMIGFVSVMGKTYQDDIDTFKSLMNFFGPEFKSISALILTHCDKISNERIHQLTDELKTHPKCAEVVNYCELGVHHHGTLDVDDLDTYTPELRVRVEELTLSRLLPMRAELTKFLLSRSNRYVEIKQTDFIRFRKQMGQKAS